MDYFFGWFFFRFTKEQKKEIEKYLNPKKKVGFYLDCYTIEFPSFFPKSFQKWIITKIQEILGLNQESI